MKARTIQLLLLFGSRFVQTVMRMAMGPLLVYICDDMECEASTLGSLLSAFSLGYVGTQVIGGKLADKIGSKTLITVASLAAGLLTCLSGMAPNVYQLWFVQVVMGVCQGPLFPASIAYLSRWLPAEDKALGSTMLDTGITIGSMVALPFSGTLALKLGWRGTFQVYGCASIIFSIVWQLLAVEQPAECKYITQDELEYLKKTVITAKGKTQKQLSMREVLSHSSVWAIIVAHMAFNFNVYFTTGWAPIYFSKVLGVRPEHATAALFLPPLLNTLVKMFWNAPFEQWMRNSRNFDTIQCRRTFSVVGFIGCSLTIMLVHPVSSLGLWACAVCFAFNNSFAALHPAGFKANYMDVTLYNAGVVSGIGNTMASMSSFLGPLLVSKILAVFDSWTLVFGAVGFFNMLAAVVYLNYSSSEPIDKESGFSKPMVKK